MKKRRQKHPLENDQDGVLQDYQNTLQSTHGKHGAEALHMFFSPNRIPVGLTDEETRICVLLYPLRKADQERTRKKVKEEIRDRDGVIDSPEQELELLTRTMPQSLPSELSPIKTMTRSRFKRGVHKFLAAVAKNSE